MSLQGWICPKCNGGVSPFADRCPCSEGRAAELPPGRAVKPHRSGGGRDVWREPTINPDDIQGPYPKPRDPTRDNVGAWVRRAHWNDPPPMFQGGRA